MLPPCETGTRAWSHRLNRRTTWPANKSKVEIAGCSVRANSAAGAGAQSKARSAQSLRLDVGRADDFAPHFGLDLDAACEFLRRAGDRFETERGQHLPPAPHCEDRPDIPPTPPPS